MTVPGCSCLGYFIYSLLYTVPWQQWVDGWKGYFSSEFTERNPLWRGVLVAGAWVSWVQCVHSRKSRKTLVFFLISRSLLFTPLLLQPRMPAGARCFPQSTWVFLPQFAWSIGSPTVMQREVFYSYPKAHWGKPKINRDRAGMVESEPFRLMQWELFIDFR